ncbi:MAG: NifB/NifX family molybdenum-iron cluster-binding protein [Bacillota bacterium]
MKLAVSAREKGLGAEVDQRFGRCPYFVMVDSDSEEEIETIVNYNADSAGGAGPQSAQLLSKHKVDAVATGNVGPNAVNALKAAKIKIYTGADGTVESTLKRFKEGQLSQVTEATAGPHSGLRGQH